MSEMVERLEAVFAEAIADGEGNAAYFARLALHTMREPSYGMQHAAMTAARLASPPLLPACKELHASGAVWEAMIDAALTGQ